MKIAIMTVFLNVIFLSLSLSCSMQDSTSSDDSTSELSANDSTDLGTASSASSDDLTSELGSDSEKVSIPSGDQKRDPSSVTTPNVSDLVSSDSNSGLDALESPETVNKEGTKKQTKKNAGSATLKGRERRASTVRDVVHPKVTPVTYSVSNSDFDMSKTEEYEVAGENETLMWISFHLFGDYRKWRQLVSWNGNGIATRKLSPGDKINYHPLKVAFNWAPQGNPYLIQGGDYLGKISSKVYGSSRHWIKIYDNNKPMIRDPNLIFAGFTIYYPNK